MYRSVQVRASIGSVDLTDYIEDFKFERSDEKDDFLYLTLDGSRYADFQNAIIVGKSLSFKYGFIEDFSSNYRSTRISEIDIKYSGKMKIILKCLDLGNVIKKIVSEKVWKGKANEIAKQIADKYGLAFEDQIGYNFTSYSSLPQAFRTDFEFLKYLAAKEGDIDIWIGEGKLHFKAMNLGGEPKRTYIYGDGKNVISVEISYKSASTKPEIGGVQSKKVDEKGGLGGLAMQVEYENAQRAAMFSQWKENVRLGESRNFMGETTFRNVDRKDPRHPDQMTLGAKVAKNTLWIQETTMARVYTDVYRATGDSDKADAAMLPYAKQYYNDENLNNYRSVLGTGYGFGEVEDKVRIVHLPTAGLGDQNATKKDLTKKSNDETKKILTCELEIELDIGIRIGEIVKIEGLVSRHNGNWYVSEVVDTIRKSGGATSKLTLTRGKLIGESTKGANTNKGSETPKNFVERRSANAAKKPPVIYDFNGDSPLGFGQKGFPQQIQGEVSNEIMKKYEQYAQ